MLSDYYRRQVYVGGLQERRELAMHESAHAAIVALSIEPHLSGSLLLGVSIERSCEAAGWVDGRTSSRPGGRPLALRAMAVAAGPCAEFKVAKGFGLYRVRTLTAKRPREMPGSADDWSRFDAVAEFLAADVMRPVADVQAMLVNATEAALNLHRRAIEALADVLLERGWLPGAEAAGIVRSVEPKVVIAAPDLRARATTPAPQTIANKAGSGRRANAADFIRRGEEAVANLSAANMARVAKARR